MDTVIFNGFSSDFEDNLQEVADTSKMKFLFTENSSQITETPILIFNNKSEDQLHDLPQVTIGDKTQSVSELGQIKETTNEALIQKMILWITDINLLHRFYGSLNEGIVIVNKQRRIIYVNSAGLELFEYEKKEVLFKNLNILLDEEIHQRHNEHFEQVNNQDEKKGFRLNNKNNIGITKSRKKLHLDITVNHLDLGDEKFYLSSIRDVSRTYEAEREVAEKNKQLDQYAEELKTSLEVNERRNEILKSQNEQLDSSLRYASSIQSVFHSNENQIKDFFPKSFQIFKPQHIVSGDIVWSTDTHMGKMIAVIDCMGHGVPGALLSISVINCLESVARMQNFYSVSSFMAKVVELYLKSINGQISDTFDISICLFDKLSRLVFFKGLKRPLNIIRDGNIETVAGLSYNIHEFYEASKNSTFLQDDVRPIHKGDRLYMYTDGYPDQFGGPRNKKLKLGKFKSLLMQTASLPIENQGKEMSDFFESWRTEVSKDNFQVDDVTVLGIEI